jgi:citrate synthase
MNQSEFLNARDAAARLGVKLDTLYAYVSRGLLRSVAVPGSRERHYRRNDIEAFGAARGSARAVSDDGAEGVMPAIDSAISLIEDGRLYYRGHDAVRLSDSATLEDIAALLWGVAADPARSARRAEKADAGRAAARVEAMFHAEKAGDDWIMATAARLARGEELPGIGQPLYPDGDPRALAIVEAVAKALPEAGARIAAAAAAAHQLTGQYANVDFALGAAVTALGLPPGAALGLFVVGRTVGWIAHAIEQYESRILIRPRARYIGKRPTGL